MRRMQRPPSQEKVHNNLTTFGTPTVPNSKNGKMFIDVTSSSSGVTLNALLWYLSDMNLLPKKKTLVH